MPPWFGSGSPVYVTPEPTAAVGTYLHDCSALGACWGKLCCGEKEFMNTFERKFPRLKLDLYVNGIKVRCYDGSDRTPFDDVV